MIVRPALVTLRLAPGPGAAFAGTVGVRMLDRGKTDSKVFEPNHVGFEPGDTIRFRVGRRSRDAVSIAGMVPAGAASFKGRLDGEMVVRLGAADFVAASLPARAKTRFEALLERVVPESGGR